MLVKRPDIGYQIPEELAWLKDVIMSCDALQRQNGVPDSFVYVTVRHGIVDTATDDEWHVDGFSMRVPHRPEQNYIYTSTNGTEYLTEGFSIPEDFNPMRHNLHKYFSRYFGDREVHKVADGRLILIDPYVVHRRPPSTAGQQRTFFRISFVPIEIEDDTCQRNPLFPEKIYGRADVRKELIEYLDVDAWIQSTDFGSLFESDTSFDRIPVSVNDAAPRSP